MVICYSRPNGLRQPPAKGLLAVSQTVGRNSFHENRLQACMPTLPGWHCLLDGRNLMAQAQNDPVGKRLDQEPGGQRFCLSSVTSQLHALEPASKRSVWALQETKCPSSLCTNAYEEKMVPQSCQQVGRLLSCRTNHCGTYSGGEIWLKLYDSVEQMSLSQCLSRTHKENL